MREKVRHDAIGRYARNALSERRRETGCGEKRHNRPEERGGGPDDGAGKRDQVRAALNSPPAGIVHYAYEASEQRDDATRDNENERHQRGG